MIFNLRLVLCNKVNKKILQPFLPKVIDLIILLKTKLKNKSFYFKWFLEPSFGEAGDIVAFFNKTLHGVQLNRRQEKIYSLINFISSRFDKNAKSLILPEITLYGKKFDDIFSKRCFKIKLFTKKKR